MPTPKSGRVKRFNISIKVFIIMDYEGPDPKLKSRMYEDFMTSLCVARNE